MKTQIICDNCSNFYQSQDLTRERCDFSSNLLSRKYFEDRVNGDKNYCIAHRTIF